jgi:hypothetical protein
MSVRTLAVLATIACLIVGLWEIHLGNDGAGIALIFGFLSGVGVLWHWLWRNDSDAAILSALRSIFQWFYS